jgi:hypothetical protein
MKLTFQKKCLLAKLHDELVGAGLSPLQEDETTAVQGTETEVFIYVPDNTPESVITQITTIVNNHVPTLAPSVEAKQQLAETDLDMVRIIEDLIKLLIAKGVIAETDLPQAARNKIQQRNNLRALLAN